MKYLLQLALLALLVGGCKKKEEETPAAPFVDFTITNSIKTHPDTVLLDATSSQSGTLFSWDFGDGSSKGSGQSTTHIFDYGYYFIVLSGTNNGQTSTTRHGINLSPFSKILISNITVTRIPSTNSNSEAWDTDGTGPDVFCRLSIPSNSVSTGATANVTGGTVSLPYATSLVVNSIDQFIKLEIIDTDAPALSDEIIETITQSDGVTSLMTSTVPYQTTLTFTGSTTTAVITFQWLN